MKKFIVVGGNPYRMYTGTITFTHLRELGQFNTQEEADRCIEQNYDECGGLLDVFVVEKEKEDAS